jgi:hypothetical protein
MAKTFCRGVVGLAVLYALAVAAFALFHYEGERPDVPGLFADFHGWVGGLFGGSRAAPREPRAEVPPPPPPPPDPTPPPPPPPPVQPPPAVARDPVETALSAIEDETLPRAETIARTLRDMDRGPDFDAKRGEVLGLLGKARDVLDPILEKTPAHPRANRLWDRLQNLSNAVRRL